MTNQQSKPNKPPRDPRLPLSWENELGLSLGGAGAALVVILSTLQLRAQALSECLNVESYDFVILCCMGSLTLWIALWKICDTRAYWKKKYPQSTDSPYHHSMKVLFFSFALATLWGGIVHLFHISNPSGAYFVALFSLVLTLVLILHSRREKRRLESRGHTPRRLRRRS